LWRRRALRLDLIAALVWSSAQSGLEVGDGFYV
jgi:hypothetical protein